MNWINYQDNIIPKLIYWPVLLGSATIITAVTLLPEEQKSDSSKREEQSLLPNIRLSRETTFSSFNLDQIDSEEGRGQKLPFLTQQAELSPLRSTVQPFCLLSSYAQRRVRVAPRQQTCERSRSAYKLLPFLITIWASDQGKHI